MQWLQRMEAGPDLEWKLEREVALVAIDHPNFVVRLHGMGDFYSWTMSRCGGGCWSGMRGLRVFGYTARMDDAIADALRALARDAGWSRFRHAVFQCGDSARSTVTIESVRQKPAAPSCARSKSAAPSRARRAPLLAIGEADRFFAALSRPRLRIRPKTYDLTQRCSRQIGG